METRMAELGSTGDPAVLVQQALTAHQEGALDLAEQKYRRLLEIEPGNVLALNNVMALLLNTGRFGEALEICRTVRAAVPESREALSQMTAILLRDSSAQGIAADVERTVRDYGMLLRKDGADESARAELSSLVTRFMGQLGDGYRPCLIATVGGAGTYFTVHFFEFLERRAGFYSKDYDPVQGGGFRTLTAFPNLGLLKLTSHAICPGFESYDGPLRDAWESLAKEGEPERVEAPARDWFDPSKTPNTRLVHIYRDPYEHTITGYRSALRQGRVNADSPESLAEFVRGFDIKRFVAQYFSFKVMAERFPENIMLVPFERLVGESEAVFRSMLRFFGVPPLSGDLIRSSLKSSSPQALKRAEDRAGRASGPTSARTHFDRDPAGRNRVVLTDSDRDVIRQVFARLGIAMSDFEHGV